MDAIIGVRNCPCRVWSFALIYRSLVRALITSAALAAGVLLAGCNSDEISLATNAKANQPVPPKLIAAMTEKDMDLNSPILVRLFKEEAELEVWKQDRSGRFALLKTYPICRWSGDLGPKVREGDRQAPEGFYSISPAQMNPQSAYYLSFNTGFPNAFDRSLGRTGSELMVHGDCSSRGCYAMTDEQIAEIYSLGRESFFGGQHAFQFQAYPFRMTAANMAKHRNNPNMPFWRMIKEGNDHFEVTKQEPKVDFCEKKYVFDAVKAPDAKRDPVFEASAKCPAYVIPDEIADAVRQKQQQDDAEMARACCQGHADGQAQYRHRRRHEQGFRRRVTQWRYRAFRWRRGSGPVAGAMSRLPGTIPSPRQSAALRRAVTNLLSRPHRRPRPRRPHVDPGRVRCAGTRSPTASSPASPARSASAAPIPPRAPPPPPPAPRDRSRKSKPSAQAKPEAKPPTSGKPPPSPR